MTTQYEYPLDSEVTIRYPTGRELDGVVAARKRVRRGHSIINRYTILFDNDMAETMVPPTWIHPRRQRSLLSPVDSDWEEFCKSKADPHDVAWGDGA